MGVQIGPSSPRMIADEEVGTPERTHRPSGEGHASPKDQMRGIPRHGEDGEMILRTAEIAEDRDHQQSPWMTWTENPFLVESVEDQIPEGNWMEFPLGLSKRHAKEQTSTPKSL